MAYEDDKKTTFPTRNGTATGTSNERTMLEELGGVDGIRHRQRLGSDGVATHVKTRGGFPHFWNDPIPATEEDLSPIYMDSGVVDLLSVAQNNPLSYQAAPLYYGTHQQSYFIAQKLLGEITPPSITNQNPPVSGVPGESFIPVDGSDILGKKDCGALCPPSVFTGKAKLYAQAQLGAPLIRWDWTLDVPIGQPPQWVHDNGFVLSTNVGVYTDDTNKHWLLSLSGGTGFMVTPLKPTKAAKALVPLLSDPVYATDKTQIEAYILAYSKPGTSAESVFIPKDSLPPAYMLGYGWKFNWDGSKADIIKHVVGFPKHSTTHYRLTFTRNTGSGFNTEADRWSAAMSIVEGPVEWHNSRFASVIAHPEWTTNLLYIFGTNLGTNEADDVPVYCFYKDDDTLEVFRHTHVPSVSGTKARRTSYPPSWGMTCDWTADPYVAMNATAYDTFTTFFTDGGGSTWQQRTSSPESYGFTCSKGSTVRSAEYYAFQDRTTAGKIVNNTDVVWGGFGWEQNQPDPVPDVGVRHVRYETNPVTLSDGVIATTGSAVYVSDNVSGPAGLYQGAFLCYHRIVGMRGDEGTHAESTKSLLVVPFRDAAAAYVYGTHSTTRTSTGFSGDNNGGMDNVWGNPLRVQVAGSTVAEWTIGRVHDGSWGTPDTVNETWTDRITTSTETTLSKLVFAGGESAFTPPISLDQFFAGVDYVAQNFYTTSNVHGAVYGFGAKNLLGFPNTITLYPPPFIGWA